MEDFPEKKITARKKLILAFVIINFLTLLGWAVAIYILILSITPVEPDVSWALAIIIIFPMFISACILTIIAVIELIFGILTYKGKRWAAIAMIVCVGITWIGIFGAVAAVLELTNSNKPPQITDN